MTTKSVATEQHNVDCENNCADTQAESAIEPERFPNVVTQDENKNEREIQKIAVHVLHDQRKGALTEISFARLANGAGGRIRPERLVIGASIIIAGQPEPARRPKNQKCRRKNQPPRPPTGFRSEPAVR